jgi:hypothetical protein
MLRWQKGKTPAEMAPDDATRAALLRGAITRCAAPATGVPADVATLLARLSLSSYAPALCGQLGLSSVAAAAHITDADLLAVGLKPLERRLLLAEAAARQRSAAGGGKAHSCCGTA